MTWIPSPDFWHGLLGGSTIMGAFYLGYDWWLKRTWHKHAKQFSEWNIKCPTCGR